MWTYLSLSSGWGLYVNFSSTDTMFVKVICRGNITRDKLDNVKSCNVLCKRVRACESSNMKVHC